VGKGSELIAPKVQAETEVLPSASTQWRGLLDTSLGAPPEIPVYTDPASIAVATEMNHWPAIHEVMTNERDAAADALVAANNNTSGAFAATDHGNAGNIQSVQPPSSSGTMMV
jgi:hypothetical protein